MEISLSNLITTALAAGVVAAIALLLNQRSQLVRIETLLTGADGSNGIVGDVKALRAKSHIHSDELHALEGKVEIQIMRIDGLDRRVGPEDRRAHG